MPKKYSNLLARLHANSVVSTTPYAELEQPCRLWCGALNNSGYGKLNVRHRHRDRRTGHRRLKTLLAHRVALALHLGVPVWRMNHVLHRCDRRNCIEPTHLRSSTQLKNVKETVEKGRHRNGATKRRESGST